MTNRLQWQVLLPNWQWNLWRKYTDQAYRRFPTVEFPSKYEKPLRKILDLQGKISDCNSEIKKYESEVEAHSVRIAELMKNHEHGILTTTTDKILIDFATKKSKRTNTSALKKD